MCGGSLIRHETVGVGAQMEGLVLDWSTGNSFHVTCRKSKELGINTYQ